jgi:hypothetical protein
LHDIAAAAVRFFGGLVIAAGNRHVCAEQGHASHW